MSVTRGDRRGREIGHLFKREVTPAERLCDDGRTPMKIECGALSDTVKRAERESATREILRQGDLSLSESETRLHHGLRGVLTRTKHRTLVHRETSDGVF